jgi:hypothetical protein
MSIEQLREMVEDQQHNYEDLNREIQEIKNDQQKIKKLIDFEYELFNDGSDKDPNAIQRKIEKVEESMVNILKSFPKINKNNIKFQRHLRKEWLSDIFDEPDIECILDCHDCEKSFKQLYEECDLSQIILCAYSYSNQIRDFIKKNIDKSISETSKNNKSNLKILNQIKKDVNKQK